MRVNDFKEKDIRAKILNKVKPEIQKGRAKHSKGKVFVGGKMVAIVKLPNDHKRIMKHSKSKYIASSLRLEPSEFNKLIECTLSGSNYYKIIKEKLSL